MTACSRVNRDIVDCAICFDRIDDNPLKNLACIAKNEHGESPHIFHTACLKTWFNSSSANSCPTCRQEVDAGAYLDPIVQRELSNVALNQLFEHFSINEKSGVAVPATIKKIMSSVEYIFNELFLEPHRLPIVIAAKKSDCLKALNTCNESTVAEAALELYFSDDNILSENEFQSFIPKLGDINALRYVDVSIVEKHTYLIKAAVSNNALLVEGLVHLGAELEVGDSNGGTALEYSMYALKQVTIDGEEQIINREAFDKLIECGADVTTKHPGGAGLLHIAILLNLPVLLQELILMNKIDLNGAAQTDQDDDLQTPLDYAIARGNTACVEVLRNASAKSYVEIPKGGLSNFYNRFLIPIREGIDNRLENYFDGRFYSSDLLFTIIAFIAYMYYSVFFDSESPAHE